MNVIAKRSRYYSAVSLH